MDAPVSKAGQDKNKSKDVAYSWVSTSRYLFYWQLAIGLALFIGMCWALYANRYKGKPHVEVPTNTMYNPTYK